jgi:hypothetical protein
VLAIDREGNLVPVTASIASAASDAFQVTVTDGHPVHVPAGSYNAAAWVWEPNEKAATLVDHPIDITGSVTVAFDAQGGRPVRFTVNDRTVAQDSVLAEPYNPVTGEYMWWNNGFGSISGAMVYVVPGALPSGWNLLLVADLVRHRPEFASPSPVEYGLVRVLQENVPERLTFSDTRAGLAHEHVTIRDFGNFSDGVSFSPFKYDGSASYGQLIGGNIGQANFLTPAAIDVYFSPGYQWESVSDAASNDIDGTAPLLAGHNYALTFNSAVFSPSPLFGPQLFGNSLHTTESFGNDLIADPGNPPGMSVGPNPVAPEGWLYKGSTLIAHSKGYNHDVTARISATPAWYTLRAHAVRVNANGSVIPGFSTSVWASYTFKAYANDKGLDGSSTFWPRMIPRGLSLRNTARRGSHTTVPMTFDILSGAAIDVHGVRVWASVNDGKSWTALRVSQSRRTWTVTVANPAKAGWVSLRVRAVNSDGFISNVTVIHAYAVS